MCFVVCHYFTFKALKYKIQNLTMWCILLSYNDTLLVVSLIRSMALDIVISWNIHAVSCIKFNIDNLSLSSISPLFKVNIEEVKWCFILLEFLNHANIYVLAENGGHNFVFFLTFENTNVLFIYNLLWSTFEVNPVGIKSVSLSQDLSDWIVSNHSWYMELTVLSS